MSKLERLIQQYCPDGVEWKALYSITKQFSGMTGVSNKWAEEGNCVFIDYNNVYNHTSVDTTALKKATVKSLKQNTLKKGDILFTSASETPDECALSSVIEKDLPDGVFLDDHLFGLRLLDEYSSVISPSYLKYAFRSEQFRFQIKKVVRGATRHYVSKVDFMKLEIPVPPLPVQEEIVRILDAFTELQAELQAELQKRKQQYNYYLDNLLNFKNINRGGYQAEVRWMKMSEVFEIRNGYTPSKAKKEFWEGGTIPWFRMEDIRQNGRILSDSILHITPKGVKGKGLFKANSFILATTATIGEHALIIADSLANQRFTNLSIRKSLENELSVKYVYYYFFVIDEWCKANTNVSNFASVDMSKFHNLLIPIPSIAEQQKIVSILDRFDTLTNDLTSGLPAEMEKRRQQYEYYRDRLLTFKRL